MQTYRRILSYAGPFKKLASYYFLAYLLAISFGLANFSLLIPILKVLFNQTELQTAISTMSKPTFSLGIPYLKDLFNYCFMYVLTTAGTVKALYFVTTFFVLSFFLNDLFAYLADLIMARVRTNVIRNLRAALFEQTIHLHLGYFTDQKKGDIMARVTNDVQEIEHAVADTLKVCLKNPTQIACFIIVLFYMSMELTLFTLILLPIAGLIIAEIIKSLRKWAHQTQESLGRLMNILEETLWGMRIIKIFGAGSYAQKKFKEENNLYATTSINVAKKESLAGPMSEFLGILAVSTILVHGGKLVLLETSNLTASTFITYIIIFSQALVPIKSISKSISHIQRGLAAGKRIFNLLDHQKETAIVKSPVHIEKFDQAITFKNVSFSYDKNTVLHALNFTIPKGKTVALVGSSGGGKSTIVDLVLRLYDVTSGTIMIDGTPLQNLDPLSWSKLVGTVTQESILFYDTIFNNIAFSRPSIQDAAVIEAAQIAHAHDFIMALPQQYQTIIGEQGNKLSSGQKQRLCIARAIVGKPPILILDEATSCLDNASERRVQNALDKLIQGQTSLVIAHRLSTIQNADEILVIEEGTIVERGTHATLVQHEGVYQKLNSIQKME